MGWGEREREREEALVSFEVLFSEQLELDLNLTPHNSHCLSGLEVCNLFSNHGPFSFDIGNCSSLPSVGSRRTYKSINTATPLARSCSPQVSGFASWQCNRQITAVPIHLLTPLSFRSVVTWNLGSTETRKQKNLLLFQRHTHTHPKLKERL